MIAALLAHGPGGLYDWGPMVMGGGMLAYAYRLIRTTGRSGTKKHDEDPHDE